MRVLILASIAILVTACASQPKVENVGTATARNGGDLPESGLYNDDQNESLAITVKSLQSEIFEQEQKINQLQQEVQAEKLRNQNLVHEQALLQARAHAKQQRDTASIRAWKPNGDPVIEHHPDEGQ